MANQLGELQGKASGAAVTWSYWVVSTHFLEEGYVLVAMKPNGSRKHVVVGSRFGNRHFPNRVDWGIHP